MNKELLKQYSIPNSIIKQLRTKAVDVDSYIKPGLTSEQVYLICNRLLNPFRDVDAAAIYSKPGFKNYHIGMIDRLLQNYPEFKFALDGLTPEEMFKMSYILVKYISFDTATIENILNSNVDLELKFLAIMLLANDRLPGEVEMMFNGVLPLKLNKDELLKTLFGEKLCNKMSENDSLIRYEFSDVYDVETAKLFDDMQMYILLIEADIDKTQFYAKPELTAEEMWQIKRQLDDCGNLISVKSAMRRQIWPEYYETYRSIAPSSYTLPAFAEEVNVNGKPAIATLKISEPKWIWFSEELAPNPEWISSPKPNEVRRHISKFDFSDKQLACLYSIKLEHLDVKYVTDVNMSPKDMKRIAKDRVYFPEKYSEKFKQKQECNESTPKPGNGTTKMNII